MAEQQGEGYEAAAWDEMAVEAYLQEAIYALPVLLLYCFSFSLKRVLFLNHWLPWVAWLDTLVVSARQSVRRWIYHRVEADMWIVIGIRRMRMSMPSAARNVIDLLASLTEFSVSIPFFVALIPLLYLLGYTNEACLLLIGLACLTLLISGIKDNFCSPRPSQHPSILIKLNKPEDASLLRDFLSIRVEQDYSCPSLHAACSLFFGLCVTSLVLAQSPQATTDVTSPSPGDDLTMLPAIVWCIWVSFTRLWLGVHSIIDLSLGAIVGLAVYYSWRLSAPLQVSLLFPTRDNPISGALIEQIEQAGWTAGSYSLLYSLTGLINHWVTIVFIPRPIHRTESFEHTTTWLGAWGGLYLSRILLGSAMGIQSKKGSPSLSSPRYQDWASGSIFSPYLIPRVALGLIVSGLVRVVAKQELTPWLSWTMDQLGPLRRFLQPPVSNVPLPAFFPLPGSVEDSREEELNVDRSRGDVPADVDALRRYLNYSLLTLSVLVFHEYF